MKSKVVLEERKFEEIDKMLNGVANRYANWGGISRDDIYQECWLKTMQLIEAYGEVPDMNLICQSCYNRIFDLGRYQARRVNQIPVDPAQFDYSGTEDHAENKDSAMFRDTEWSASSHIGSDFMSGIVLDEIEKLFNENSNEREYVRELEIYIGVREVTKSEIDKLFDFSASMENELAWNLGFANSGSNGYRNVKRRVRAAIAEYLGLTEYNKNC